MQPISSLADLLITRARHEPQRVGWRFLTTGDVDGGVEALSWGGLLARAAGVAGRLLAHARKGDRALLLFPPGLDFHVAFYACQLAGVVAVPVPPPEPEKLASSLPRLLGIVGDAAPAVVLSVEMVRELASGMVPEMASIPWIAVDTVEAAALPEDLPVVGPEDLSFLQYTSGSTGDPKGVMVSHGNILANAAMIQHTMGCFERYDEAERASGFARADRALGAVSWLPTFHDMGLIGFVIAPLFIGETVTHLSPLDFLRRPARWLEAIHHFRAGISGGPNFAYALVARKMDAAERRRLDLACWRVAFSGAEPVRAATLTAFAEAFAHSGFDPGAWLPSYGLAEATLQVSAQRGLRSGAFSGLEAGRAVPGHDNDPVLVCNGAAVPGCEIRIASREAPRRALAEGEVGEILVAGPHVAAGYFRRPEDPAFAGRIQGEEGRWLCTGDLGFLRDGQLYVAGRVKDLVVLHGRNHYPQDLEASVERAHPAVRPGGQAAFSVDDGRAERLVLVCEADPSGDLAAVRDAIRGVLSREHGVDAEIVLVSPRAVPRTSSGKVQRQRCKAQWRAGELPVIAAPAPAPASPPAAEDEAVNPAEVRAWITAWIQSQVRPGPVSEGVPLSAAGLDSLQIVQLAADLERWLGFEVPPELMFGTPIRRLAALLAHGQRQLGGGGARDLARDAELPADLVPGNAAPGEAILLTGATGFLGSYLLQELLRRTDRPILCLARAHDDDAALARVARIASGFGFSLSDRVSAVAGDLSQPRFGLDPAAFEALAGRVGAIYHSGAEIHWGKGYSSLKATNVGGTLEVLRLAAVTGAPIHHVSSIGVFPFAEDTRPEFAEDARVEEGDRLRLGYSQSKWVAERLLENAASRGFSVTIYRPGIISGDSRNGAELDPEGQLFHAFVAGILKMGQAPAVEKVIDVVPVDWVAAAIVALSLDPRAQSRRFNLVNPRPMRQRELYRGLRAQGYALREIAYPRWREEVLRCGDNPLTRFSIYYRLQTEARMARMEIQMAERLPLETRHSARLLAELGVDCPAFDERLLGIYLDEWRRRGLVPAAPRVAVEPAVGGRPTPTLVDMLNPTDDRLLGLYTRGKERQWDAEVRIDWSIPMDAENPQDLPDTAMPLYGSDLWRRMNATERGLARRHFQAWQLSQFMHGEQGALLCAARIVQQAPTAEGRLYAATQVMDESRHLEVFSRLLREKFEVSYPVTAPLQRLLDQVLTDARWDMTALGMQVLIEGLALAAFGTIRGQSKNRLAVQVNAYVMEDEARHVAFGTRLLQPFYAELSEAERREREEFVVEASYLLRDRFQALDVWEALGLPAGACAAWLRESGFQRAWRTELFSRIVPVIRAIGLWGEPVRKAYAAMGVMAFAEADPDLAGLHDERVAARVEAGLQPSA